MARRSHKSRTSKLVCAMLFAATFVAGRGVVSAQSLPQFPGEGGQSAASAAASSAAFAADNAARSAALLAQNPGGPCSAYLAQNAAYAASSAAAAAAAAGEVFVLRKEGDRAHWSFQENDSAPCHKATCGFVRCSPLSPESV